MKLSKLREAGFKIQGGGVGYYPRSGSPFVHLDVGNVRAWPRMTRTELARIFPDGKTLHLPADGKPLPGYSQAMAEYKQRRGAPVSIDRSTSVASNSRSGKGLLAALFGGADEEEEASGEVARVTPKSRPSAPAPAAAPAEPPAAAAPPAAAPEPERQKSAETLMASLPRSAVPAPVFAERAPPRPTVDVGEQQADPSAPEPAPVVVADIPLPTRRPNYTPAAIPDTGGEELVAAINAGNQQAGTVVTSIAPTPRPDTGSREILAALAETEVEPQAANIPLPGKRPQQAESETVIAALPVERPVARDFAVTGKGARVTATPRSAIQGAENPAERTERVLSGARTTDKAPRPDASAARPAPRSVEKPIEPDNARFALQAGAVPQPAGPPRTTPALRAAPSTVLASGFTPGAQQENANRFTGKAVTFLSVVKFSSTN